MAISMGHKDETQAAPGGAALGAFKEYFSAFLSGSDEAFAASVALPFFVDLQEGELLQMRSPAQLDGFRRGLRARLASLGYALIELANVRELMVEPTLALIQFESRRHGPGGEAMGGMNGLAYLRRDQLTWRVWMMTVLKELESAVP
jgi:hypothetical protein